MVTKIRNKQCSVPLEDGDLKTYDIVPDGKLYRKEFSRETLDCLVSRLINTRLRSIRDQFATAMQNDLWEEVAKKLRSRLRKGGLTKEQIESIKSLLRHEFNQRIFSGTASLQSAYDYYTIYNSLPGFTSTEKRHLHTLTANGLFQINIPFSNWRFKSKSILKGTILSSFLTYIQRTSEEPSSTRQDFTSYGVFGSSALELIDRKSRYCFSLETSAERIWDSPPDSKKHSLSAKAAVSARHVLGSRFSLNMSASLSKSAWTPPLDIGLNTRRSDLTTAYGEMSYLLNKKIGIFLTYKFSDTDSTQSLYSSHDSSHVATALAHFKIRNGYFRVGAGGGTWQQHFKFSSESQESSSGGANAYAYTEFLWQYAKLLKLKTTASINANRSEGDFNGWYPSWSAMAILALNGKTFSAALLASLTGHHRDLDQKQEKNEGAFDLTLGYRPSRRINISLSSSYRITSQELFQAYAEQYWGIHTTIGFGIAKKPDLWLSLWTGYSGTKYKQRTADSIDRLYHGTWAYLTIEGRF